MPDGERQLLHPKLDISSTLGLFLLFNQLQFRTPSVLCCTQNYWPLSFCSGQLVLSITSFSQHHSVRRLIFGHQLITVSTTTSFFLFQYLPSQLFSPTPLGSSINQIQYCSALFLSLYSTSLGSFIYSFLIQADNLGSSFAWFFGQEHLQLALIHHTCRRKMPPADPSTAGRLSPYVFPILNHAMC